jgi:cytosine/adenosine deaminase-related metal-dependent hydrolase
MILRARIILPVTAPPIEDGAVFIDGSQIRSVSSYQDLRPHLRKKVIDLGEVIVLPGLINAHCHLDYTDMAGELPPTKTFTDWIAAILGAKSGRTYSDYARSWVRGAQQLLQSGTTTVGDIEAMPDLLPDVWETTPLRVISFLEMTGIKSGRPPKEILDQAMAKIDSLNHRRQRAALSPHAPYSTRADLLRLAARISRRRKMPISIHVAESVQEYEMFMNARGPMYTWMARNGRDNSDCGLGSPIAHLARNQLLGDNVLAVHVNYLGRGDATLLAKNRTHVVHCPRSHEYFKHRTFERERLAKVGVNLCLGTDSLATTLKNGKRKPELNLFSEMRTLANNDKSVSPEEILAMATVNGARALGLSGKTGELAKSTLADLIAIPYAGKSPRAVEAVMEHTGHVNVSMIEGRWAIPPA